MVNKNHLTESSKYYYTARSLQIRSEQRAQILYEITIKQTNGTKKNKTINTNILFGWLLERLTSLSSFSTKIGYIGDKALRRDLVPPG